MSRRSQWLAGAFFAVTLTTVTPTTAQAGIPIPCTADRIVKVADLPADFQKEGRQVSLGYMFTGCLSGEFVGYLGDGRQYLKLSDDMQQTIRASGQSAPGFWSSAWKNKGQFWVEWLWIVLVGFGVGAALKNKLLHGTFAHPNVIAKQQAAAAAKAAEAGGPAPVATTRMVRARVMPSTANGGSAPSFGRR